MGGGKRGNGALINGGLNLGRSMQYGGGGGGLYGGGGGKLKDATGTTGP